MYAFASIALMLIALTLAITNYFVKPLRFWSKYNIPHLPARLFFGHLYDVIVGRVPFYYFLKQHYDAFPNEPVVGFYGFNKPTLLIKDLELMKKVGTTNFNHFHDKLFICNPKKDTLFAKALLQLNGEDWRRMKSKLSPSFAVKHLREMYQLIAEVGDELMRNLNDNSRFINHMIDAKELFMLHANDVLASCAFSVRCNSFEESSFYESVKANVLMMDLWTNIKVFVLFWCASLGKLLGFAAFSTHTYEFFQNVIDKVIRHRELNPDYYRPDMIQSLIKSHLSKDGNGISKQDVAAQAFIFYLGGYDSTTTALSFLSLELGMHPDVQARLQQEIDSLQGVFTYDSITNLKYLDMVVNETLRKWPGFHVVSRVCTEDYTINLNTGTDYLIRKGDVVFIPILAIHRDRKYFPEPDQFDPERFSSENRAKIVSGSYMPFGVGPRECIGASFAVLMMKTTIVYLLNSYEIYSDTYEQPIQLERSQFFQKPIGGFRLKLIPRNK